MEDIQFLNYFPVTPTIHSATTFGVNSRNNYETCEKDCPPETDHLISIRFQEDEKTALQAAYIHTHKILDGQHNRLVCINKLLVYLIIWNYLPQL